MPNASTAVPIGPCSATIDVDQRRVRGQVVGVELADVHRGGAGRSHGARPASASSVGAAGGEHHGRAGRQPLRELDADLAAAAEDHDRSAASVSFMAAIMSCASLDADGASATTRLTNDALAFLTERHLAMLTTLRVGQFAARGGGRIHVRPEDPHRPGDHHAADRRRPSTPTQRGVAVLSQVDGARWLSLEGKATVNTDAEAVRDAELRYAQRYRTPRVNPRRVVIEVRVERVLGSSELLDRAGD